MRQRNRGKMPSWRVGRGIRVPKATTTRLSGDGEILNRHPIARKIPPGPSARLGSGGNYREAGSPDLLGKYQGAFSPVSIAQEGSNRFLRFSVSGQGSGGKDRAELSQQGYYRAGRRSLQANFRLRIPEGSGVSNNSFYLMQLWQLGGRNPFAGLRMRRGESHEVDFITKSANGGSRQLNKVARFSFVPGQWHSFQMRFRFRPGRNSTMSVAADGIQIGSWRGRAGTPNVQPIPNRGPTPYYRFKFGIYKRNEPSAGTFTTHFDDMLVGTL